MIYTIKDAISKKTFPASEDESLFYAMRKTHAGPIIHGCGGGGCGACKIEILEGEFEAFKNMSKAHISDEEKEKGIVLACCVKAKSDITLKKFGQKE